MTTFTDGAPPSVTPGPEDGPGDGTDDPDRFDSGPLWVQQEIRRRVAENAGRSGGRHARREGTAPGVPYPGLPAAFRARPDGAVDPGYPARHSVSTLGPAAFTGPIPRLPPPPAVPAPRTPAPSVPDGETPTQPGTEGPGSRVRVVLAERKRLARPVATVVDVQELTPVGDLLRSNLIGTQLVMALRFGAVAALTIGLLPVLFALFPEFGRAEVLGLRLPWLLLGIAVYPFLLGLGWWHTRVAERVEQGFAEHVQD